MYHMYIASMPRARTRHKSPGQSVLLSRITLTPHLSINLSIYHHLSIHLGMIWLTGSVTLSANHQLSVSSRVDRGPSVSRIVYILSAVVDAETALPTKSSGRFRDPA